MNIAVDGWIYERQKTGGVSRIFSEMLPWLCTIDPDVRIMLLTHPTVRQALPVHHAITCRTFAPLDRYFRPEAFWRGTRLRVRRAMLAQRLTGKQAVWHSTYYSLLPRQGTARIVSAYDLIHERFPQFFGEPGASAFRRQKQQSLRDADCLLCISQTTADDVSEHYGIDPRKTRVALLAPSTVFRPLVAADEQMSSPKPYFLYVGSRWGYKNFDRVMTAYASWHRRNEFDLVAVGASWTDAERARLRELGLERVFHARQNVDDQALRRLYCGAIALIYPSLYEGFGIPILEAMSCGCPVIASAIPSSLEIAGGCAVFFDPMDADNLQDALDMVLQSDVSSRLVTAGLTHAATFTWEKTARATLAVYREFSAAV